MATFKDMVRRLQKDGWQLDYIEGSHHHFKHPTKPGKVTIPKHTKPKDFPKWLVDSIEKQAGIK